MTRILGFASPLDLISRSATGRNVVHLGAVGETCADTEIPVGRATESVHAHLTSAASSFIGVDNDAASVTLLTERGIFGNLTLADVTTLNRDDVDMPAGGPGERYP